MQPAPASANPFSNPSQMTLLIIGILLIVIGIFVWPLIVIGILLVVFGLVWPNLMGASGGGYYQRSDYQAPQQYPAYQQPYASAAPAPQPAPQSVPQPAPQPAMPNCPRCGRPLTYVYQYQRWYCPSENVYPWG